MLAAGSSAASKLEGTTLTVGLTIIVVVGVLSFAFFGYLAHRRDKNRSSTWEGRGLRVPPLPRTGG